MHLKQIRDAVLLTTNKIPNSTAYFQNLDRIINKNILDIWMSAPWKFNSKTVQMSVVPDKNSARYTFPDSTGVDVPVLLQAINGDPYVELTSTNGMAEQVLGPEDVRQYLEIEGYDYLILAILDTQLLLAEPYRGTTDLVDYDGWKIKHVNYFLPNDLIEILDVSFRDHKTVTGSNRGKVEQIPMRMSVDMGLSTQRSADTPSCYVPAQPFYTQPPSGQASIGSSLSIEAVAATLGGGETAVPAGEYYVGFSFLYGADDTNWQGLVPESEIQWTTSALTVPANKKITTLIDNLELNNTVGMYVKYYIGVDNGIGEIVAWEVGIGNRGFPDKWYPAGGFDITGANWAGINPFLAGSTHRRAYPREDNSQACINFYPRPQIALNKIVAEVVDPDAPTATVIRSNWDLRYIYSIPKLQLNSDTVEMPPEFFQLIVDKVVSDLYLQMNNAASSAMYEAKVESRMKILRARWVDEKDFTCQRRNSWRVGSTARYGYYNYGNLVTYRP